MNNNELVLTNDLALQYLNNKDNNVKLLNFSLEEFTKAYEDGNSISITIVDNKLKSEGILYNFE